MLETGSSPELLRIVFNEDAIPIWGIVFGSLAAAAVGIAAIWAHVRKFEAEAALKRDMIDRGLSPAQIEEVLEAASSGKAALRRKMVEKGIPAKEIRRVVDGDLI